ncbi:MAG: alpha/beta fold hydrolase [Thermofilum sp.]
MKQEKKRSWKSLLPLALLAALVVLAALSSASSKALLFQGVQVQEVTVKALDGAKLRCVVYKPLQAAGKLPAVIVVHGLGGSSDTMNAISTELARNGVLVVSLNYRGHDGSEGGVNYIGDPIAAPNISNDLVAVLEYLYTRDDVDRQRVGVIGYSMGSRAALRLGLLVPSVNPVVMIGPYFSWEIGGVNATRPRNLLIIAGENDVITPPSLAQLLFGYATFSSGKPSEIFGSPREGTGRKFVVVPGADHYSLVLSKQTVEEVVAWVLLCFGMEKPVYHLDPTVVASTAASSGFLTLVGALCLAYLLSTRYLRPSASGEGAQTSSARKVLLYVALAALALYYIVSSFAIFPLVVDWGWRAYQFAMFSGAQYTIYYFLFLGIALIIALAVYGVLSKGFLPALKGSLSRNLSSGLALSVITWFYIYIMYNLTLTGLTANYAMTPLRFALMIYLLVLLLPLVLVDEVFLRRVLQENMPLKKPWGRWLATAAVQYLLRIIPLAWWVGLAANPLAVAGILNYYAAIGLVSHENIEVVRSFIPMNAYGLYYAFTSVELLHAALASYVYEEYRNPLVTAFLRAITVAFTMAAVMAIL